MSRNIGGISAIESVVSMSPPSGRVPRAPATPTIRSAGTARAATGIASRPMKEPPPREAENTALVKAGQLLFLLNDDAELIVARANRKAFDPIARYTVADSATWAQPAISGDRIFIKDVASLALWTVR